jgi:CHAT domain-containing protein
MLVRRYYDHVVTGMPPSSALARAQRWLRDDVRHATVRRFLADARVLLERDRSLPEETEELLEQLLDRYGNPRRHPLERPFSHPVFWAPFIVSGVDPVDDARVFHRQADA